jgi:Asp-tRNA(Asn)/Glu-tRNA(Gln) amidotransferase A subunit family amidase
MDEMWWMPALELASRYRARELSPVEVVEAVLARVEQLNPRLNAFLTVTADGAREAAQASEARLLHDELLGLLDGVPYSLKDLEPTRGIRTTFGSRFFEQHIPDADGVVAARMRRSGAVLLGKTNTPHFGYKELSDNLLGEPCRNPWKLDRTSGGSSAGAGAAIAAGLGPLAHGTDGAGSIRIPAAFCGIVGFKPSLGRVPYAPHADPWSATSHPGPMARTVRDAALMLQAIAGPDARDPLSIDSPPLDYLAACEGDLTGLRVAWSPDLGTGPVEPEVVAIVERAARRFTELGCALDAPIIRWPDARGFYTTIWDVTVGARNYERAQQRPDWIEPTLMRMILKAGTISAITYRQALYQRIEYYRAVLDFFENYDLLLTPTMPAGAWGWGGGADEGPGTIDGRPVAHLIDRVPFTYPFNITGQPAITVPCGFTSEGLPIGLQIVGRWHADALVLRAAACFEAVAPWAAQKPALQLTV